MKKDCAPMTEAQKKIKRRQYARKGKNDKGTTLY